MPMPMLKPTPPALCMPQRRPQFPAGARAVLAAALLAAAGAAAHAAGPADDGTFSAGVEVRKLASAREIGLPVYPGATVWTEPGEDSAGASLGLWGGAFGIRLQVLKLHSADRADAVAAYYREALPRLGRLLDCSAGSADTAPQEPEAERGKKKKLLACGDDRPKPGGFLFKLGQPDHVRMVSIEPAPSGTRLQLVGLQLRGD